MVAEFIADGRQQYIMNGRKPFEELEPLEHETAIVDQALGELVRAGMLPGAGYDRELMLAHRSSIRACCEVPSTAVTPRMERLLYAICDIARPKRVVAAGVYCGYTFLSAIGAAVGPGRTYVAEELVGLDIDAEMAEVAERNVRRIDPTGTARIVVQDARDYVAAGSEPIDLLYLDADVAGKNKDLNLGILRASWNRLRPGGLVLLHDSVMPLFVDQLSGYLSFVRGARFDGSVNIVFDNFGLEVSRKARW